MTNSAAFNAVDLHAIFGKQAVIPDYFASSGVSTDTRTMQPGNIFIALRGERFDAHANIAEAVVKGAACVVFEKRWLDTWNSTVGAEFPKFSRVVVDDCLVALAQLACHHRQRFNIPVVAVAGANGKTTTKDMIAHILRSRYLTHKTAANFNNRVGTPLTLLQLTKFHQAAVIEIGTNEPGEIASLADMVRPTHGLITNIGEEHLEKLIDLDGVAREETQLFEYCQLNNATMLVNADDPYLLSFQQHANAFSFAIDHDATLRADVHFDDSLHAVMQVRVKNEHGADHTEIFVPSVGFAASLNAVAAVATARAIGMDLNVIAEALQSFESEPAHGYARMVVQNIGGCTILNDCYNANPASMRMALRTLMGFPCTGKRIALLGDMRELGDASATAHRELVDQARAQVDTLLVVGNDMNTAAAACGKDPKIVRCDSKGSAAAWIADFMKRDDVLLLKASRGMALETVLDALGH